MQRLVVVIGLLSAVVPFAGCGSKAAPVTPPIGDASNPATANVTATSQVSLMSAHDLANVASAAEGGGSEMVKTATSPTTSNCIGGGALSEVSTIADGNTMRTWVYSGCVVRTGVTWDGNQTAIVQNGNTTTRTTTIHSDLIETSTQGDDSGDTTHITTSPDIVVQAIGLKTTGQVIRTLVSGTEHRQKSTANDANIVYNVDVSYDSLVVSDTYVEDANATNTYVMSNRVLTGSQTVHHLQWQVTASNTFTSLTWTPAACSCSAISGQVRHELAWDNGSRDADLTRQFNSCGVSAWAGTDSSNSQTIDFTLTTTCP